MIKFRTHIAGRFLHCNRNIILFCNKIITFLKWLLIDWLQTTMIRTLKLKVIIMIMIDSEKLTKKSQRSNMNRLSISSKACYPLFELRAFVKLSNVSCNPERIFCNGSCNELSVSGIESSRLSTWLAVPVNKSCTLFNRPTRIPFTTVSVVEFNRSINRLVVFFNESNRLANRSTTPWSVSLSKSALK